MWSSLYSVCVLLLLLLLLHHRQSWSSHCWYVVMIRHAHTQHHGILPCEQHLKYLAPYMTAFLGVCSQTWLGLRGSRA